MRSDVRMVGIILAALAAQLALTSTARGQSRSFVSRAFTVNNNTNHIIATRAFTVTNNTGSIIVSRAFTVTSNTGSIIVSRAFTVLNCGLTGGLDCDANGLCDACEIIDDPFLDGDANGVLDVCQNRGDIDGDGDVDLADLAVQLGNFGCTGGGCVGDVDKDGDADLADLAILLGNFGT